MNNQPGQDLALTDADLAELRSVGDEQLSGLDSRLLDLASRGKSPDEIAEELGISSIRAAQRIKEILRRRDWLSSIERKALLHDKLVKLSDYVQQQMDDQENLEPYETARGQVVFPTVDPRWADQMRKLIKDMNDQINLSGSEVNSEMNKIRRAHAKLMVGAVNLAFEYMILDVKKRYPEIEELDLRSIMEMAMPLAISSIEAQVAE